VVASVPNVRGICVPVLLLVLAAAMAGAGEDARRLFQQGQKAERAGDIVRAYVLYSQAVAGDPYNLEYWRRKELLRVPATLRLRPAAATAEVKSEATAAKSASAEEIPPARAERQPQPPPELKARPGRLDLDLRGDGLSLFTEVARTFGLEVVFDPDYRSAGALSFRLQGADYRDAIHALEAATSSFVVPLSERRLLVARDTPQKRADLEPVVSVEVPVPMAVSVQQAQDLARSVQQALSLTRVFYDAPHASILIRDRISRVRPAQVMVERLLERQTQVLIAVEFLEQASTRSSSYGFSLPALFPLVDFGKPWNSTPSLPAGFAQFLTLGGGRTLLGIGIAQAQAFANASQSLGRTLFRAELRSLDGQQASLHVGDRYPITTARFLSSNAADQLAVPATVNFEDLGLVLQLTPHVTGADEVAFDLSAEFKVLTGQTVDEIPVISNRKLESSVRLRAGEWGVVAGLMNSSQARTISGLAGFSRVPVIGPLFRKDTRDQSQDDVLVILKPSILSPPPTATQPLGLGSEQKARIPF
jgi:general secretion pathway protein D